MEKEEFSLKVEDEFIELNKLLKLMGLAQTGGHAKILIDDGQVTVNNEVEFRKRKKLRAGDVVECEGTTVEITNKE